jgi:hypothetical protein
MYRAVSLLMHSVSLEILQCHLTLCTRSSRGCSSEVTG